MNFLFASIFGFIESIWRRWYGGWIEGTMEDKLPKWLYTFLSSRGTQTVFNLIVLFAIFMLNNGFLFTLFCQWLIGLGIKDWFIAAVLSIIIQFEFWSRGHGPAFDEGRGIPTQETIDRYQKVWWVFIPNFLIPKQYWYGFLYDFIWMWVRYTIGLFLMIPFLWSFNILWLGLIATSIYALCWTLYERDSWILKYIPFNMASIPTQLAELLIGFITGFWLMWF